VPQIKNLAFITRQSCILGSALARAAESCINNLLETDENAPQEHKSFFIMCKNDAPMFSADGGPESRTNAMGSGLTWPCLIAIRVGPESA
jgi:hypothetical protein